jgi:hypothetical protein
MFAKYIRVDFKTHYGRHHYCPVSLLRVHGNSETDMWNKEQEQASSSSQEGNQLNDEPDDDQILSASFESTEEDLNELSKEIRKNSEYLDNLKDELNPAHVNQGNGITKLINQNMGVKAYLDKLRRVFEDGVCPRNDLLNVKIFQDNSLIINPGICHIDQCPIVVTESDILSDNYNVRESDRRGKIGSIKEKPARKPNKNDNNGKINLPIGGPNQSTYMFLYRGILTLESTTKRYIEEQSKIFKEMFGKVNSHSKKFDLTMDHFTSTVENLVCIIR